MRLFSRFARRLCGAQDGGVAIYVALTSVIMLGFGALVVDLSKLFTLQTEMQAAADFAALSGAMELDGTATSITRARLAAKNALITNRQSFAVGGANIVFQDSDIKFMVTLPANDDIPITAYTTDPFIAAFIEVTASARTVAYLLAPVLSVRIGGVGTAPTSGTASAVAVAGVNQVTCNYPAFMMCNPAEAGGNTGAEYAGVVGEVIKLVENGDQNATWGAGNFGLIDPPGETTAGAPAVAEHIATAGDTGCLSTLISQNTGVQVGPSQEGLNVRFDMFTGKFKNAKNRSDLAPASNVTKGRYIDGPPGNPVFPMHAPAVGLPMPTHSCFDTDTCAGLASVNSDKFAPVLDAAGWADYWNINHNGLNFNNLANFDSGVDLDGDGISDPIDVNGDGNVSRNEMYDWENEAGAIPDNTSPAGSDSTVTAENGNYKNYTGSGAVSAFRRLVSVAVVNCIEQNITGNTSNSGKLIRPKSITKIFLVKPVPDPSVGHAIFVEIAGESTIDTGTPAVHDIIQLYR